MILSAYIFRDLAKSPESFGPLRLHRPSRLDSILRVTIVATTSASIATFAKTCPSCISGLVRMCGIFPRIPTYLQYYVNL